MENVSLSHIAQRVFNRPLLLSPVYAQSFYGSLVERLNIAQVKLPNGAEINGEVLKAKATSFGRNVNREEKPYKVVDGVAMISVSGTLAHKFGYLNPLSGMTGYDGIETKITHALSDSDVRGILLDIDSPGGEVSGCFDLADFIFNARKDKPIWAVADEMACSAAYALGSSASRLILPRTAQVGSIGVLTAHTDISKLNEEKGVDVTLIYAGSHKVDANPYEKLPDSVRADIQTEIDELYTMFTNLSARNRGLKTQVIIDTQAKIYQGGSAVTNKLADAVMPANQVLSEFINHLSSSGRQTVGVTRMSSNQSPADNETSAITQAQVDQAARSASSDQQTRIASILDCDEANGRDAQAKHLAFNTSLSADDAKGILASAPLASAVVTDPLSAAMENSPSPEITDDVDAEDNVTKTSASSMANIFDKHKGVK